MHLSKCELNTARRGARRLLGSPQSMHAAVLASFPSIGESELEGTTGDGRVLWRVDTVSVNPLLYVVSPQVPDFTHIVEQAGWPTQPRWGSVDYSPLLDGLREGQEWQFRLAANPVRNQRSAEDGKRGKRYGHVTVSQQTAWLTDRAARLGVAFDVGVADSAESTIEGDGEADVTDSARRVSFRVEERTTLSFTRQRRTVTIRRVRFDGLLRVADPQKLREALVSGVGAAKGYGCGLLTLAPAPTGARG